MSDELQALCFFAGANSIFYGEKLLTTGNPDAERDRRCSRASASCRWRPSRRRTVHADMPAQRCAALRRAPGGVRDAA